MIKSEKGRVEFHGPFHEIMSDVSVILLSLKEQCEQNGDDYNSRMEEIELSMQYSSLIVSGMTREEAADIVIPKRIKEINPDGYKMFKEQIRKDDENAK